MATPTLEELKESLLKDIDDVDTWFYYRWSDYRFIPIETRRLFNKIATERPAAAEDKPITVLQTMQLYEKCHPEDLTFFIHVFLKYGNIQKVLSQAGSASTLISKKCAHYGISTERQCPSKSTLHYKAMTLSRIARAYPFHTAEVILKERLEGILTFSSFFQQDLPLIMQHTIFFYLIPGGQFRREMTDIAAVLNMETSVKLAKPEEKKNVMMKTVESSMERSHLYVCKINTLDENIKKLTILIEAGVLEKANGKLELSPMTVALLNKLPSIKAVYKLKYSEAVQKLSFSMLNSGFPTLSLV